MEKPIFDIHRLHPRLPNRPTGLDRNSPVPLYHQLKEVIRGLIENGHWRQGDPIPAENQLAEEYGLSRGTVREAMEDLVREGLLHRQRGRGTFVSAPKLEQGMMDLFSVFASTKQTGHTPGSRILECVIQEPTDTVRGYLRLTEGRLVYKLVRIRTVDGEPMMYDRVYLSADDFPDLQEKDLSNDSLYEVLARDYGAVLGKAKQTFEPVLIDQYESKLLQVEKGVPALLIERVAYRVDGTPAVYSKIIIRGDRCRFTAEIPGT